MKKLLVPSLEEIGDDVEVFEPLTEAEVEEMEAEIEKIEEESKMFFDDDEDNDARIEEGEAAVERLEYIAEIIGKYGISGPMMMVADPYRELINSGAIAVSYEEMSDVPIIGEDSVAAIEGIKDVIKGIVEKLRNIFKKIGKVFYEMQIRREKVTDHYFGLLSFAQSKMKDIKSINEDKFISKSVRAYDKATFFKLVGSFDKMIGTLSQSLITAMHGEVERFFKEASIDREAAKKASNVIASKLLSLDIKSIEDNFGLLIDQDNNGHIYYTASTSKIIKDDYKTIGEHGYKSSDAANVVNSALKLRNDIAKLNDFAKYLLQLVNSNNFERWWFKVTDENSLTEMTSVYKQYVRCIRAIMAIVRYLFKAYQNICSSAYQIGHNYIKYADKA